MKKIRLASKATCTGCLACSDSCDKKAIQGYIHRDGHLYPRINDELCVRCGRCMEVCPVISRYNYQDTDASSQPYAVWANDEEIRYNSASGGLFGALAANILLQGGWVAGASMEGVEVKHILISDIKELYKIQNSKYQQVDSTGIYKAIKGKLKQGDVVLFGGTSCQVAGLYSFLGEGEFSEKLYTVDMICSGFPSRLSLTAFLRHENSQIKTIRYRDKKDGCEKGQRLSVVLARQEGEIEKIYPKELIYAAFGTHYTHRNCCLNCHFAVARRKADITMGDFWGDPDFPEQHHKGLSLGVVHTERGAELMKSADLTIHMSSWEKALNVNYRMVYGKYQVLRFHPARRFYPWLFHHCSYTTLMKIYRGEKGNFLWLLYSLYSQFLGLIEMIIRKQIVNNRLKKLL